MGVHLDPQPGRAQLSADGEVFMPLDDDGVSERYGWVGDRFDVTWLLNLPR